MSRSAFVGASRITLLAGLAAMVIVVSSAKLGMAATTQVNTTVCSGNSSNASLVINTPLSDSVVTQLPLSVNGTIESITQVDISIDGQYNSTVPVSVNQSTFLTSLQLVEGTHTLTFEGNDVCQFQNVTQTLVVTYKPVVSQNNDPTPPVAPTDTSTPASNTSSSGGATANPGTNQFQNVPIIGALVPVAVAVAHALDFDVSAQQGGIAGAMARFALFSAGVGLAFFGAGIVHMLRKRALRDQAVEGYIQGNTVQDPSLKAHVHRNVMAVRCAGALLLCLSFVI